MFLNGAVVRVLGGEVEIVMDVKGQESKVESSITQIIM